jgi:cytochrome P450
MGETIDPLPTRAEIETPPGVGGLTARLLANPMLADLAARAGASFAARSGGPWRFGNTVLVASHSQIREVLSRDLDFCIAPINARRINEVNGPFVLGMDRGAVLADERGALYRALAAVDLSSLHDRITQAAAAKLADVEQIDVVAAYARPIAAHTASWLFGIPLTDELLFQDVARAIFAHTFLNLSDDKAVKARALKASSLMKAWLQEEIERRKSAKTHQNDMMDALLSDPNGLDSAGVRRTLGGMFVGSIDTTATTVAKIVFVLGHNKALASAVTADVNDAGRLRGWCWEALRRWPHNPILLRQASADTSLGDVVIHAGDRIVAWTQAAMQDAAAFPAPRRLRPDRPMSAYLHFGDALHACAGRSVNAFQIPLLVGAIMRRGIQSVGKVAWSGPFPNHLTIKLAR